MTDPYRIEFTREGEVCATVALSPETSARLLASAEVRFESGDKRLHVKNPTNEGDDI